GPARHHRQRRLARSHRHGHAAQRQRPGRRGRDARAQPAGPPGAAGRRGRRRRLPGRPGRAVDDRPEPAGQRGRALSMAVRPATDDDVETLAALRRAWVEEDSGPIGDPAYEQAFADWYDREGDRRLAWIGFVDGAPVGMLSMLEYR